MSGVTSSSSDTIRKWILNYLGWASCSQSSGMHMHNGSLSRCTQEKMMQRPSISQRVTWLKSLSGFEPLLEVQEEGCSISLDTGHVSPKFNPEEEWSRSEQWSVWRVGALLKGTSGRMLRGWSVADSPNLQKFPTKIWEFFLQDISEELIRNCASFVLASH